MMLAQPGIRIAHPFRLEPQDELHVAGVDPVGERPEAAGVLGRVDLPSAGVEPDHAGFRERPRTGLEPDVFAKTAGVTPAQIHVDAGVEKPLNIGDILLAAPDLNLGDRGLGLPLDPRHVVRHVPTPPHILCCDDVRALPEQHGD